MTPTLCKHYDQLREHEFRGIRFITFRGRDRAWWEAGELYGYGASEADVIADAQEKINHAIVRAKARAGA